MDSYQRELKTKKYYPKPKSKIGNCIYCLMFVFVNSPVRPANSVSAAATTTTVVITLGFDVKSDYRENDSRDETSRFPPKRCIRVSAIANWSEVQRLGWLETHRLGGRLGLRIRGKERQLRRRERQLLRKGRRLIGLRVMWQCVFKMR
jgi:hypothetical protein